MSIDLDQMALDHIVPSTREGFVIANGMKLKTVCTDKSVIVREINFYGGANCDVFGILVEDEEGEGEEYTNEELFMDHAKIRIGDFTRSSFCEVCDLHFDERFVEWSFENRDNEPFYYLPDRGLKMDRPYSICKRCDGNMSQSRILWKWLARAIKAKMICFYWYHLIHTPKYVAKHAAIMQEEMSF